MINILMFIFCKSISRAEALVIAIAVVYAINSKYKKSLLAMFLGLLLITIIELILGI